MVNFLRNCQTVFPRHLHHFTFSPERHKAYNSSISLLYDQAAQDGYSLALCTPPAWPVSSLFTGYSPDWPSYILAPAAAAAAAKLLQSCPTLCDPVDGSPLGSSVPGILQARILELVAISFSNACKWKVKVKSLSHVRPLATPWTAAYQAPLSMGFSRQEYWSGVPLPSPILNTSIYLY